MNQSKSDVDKRRCYSFWQVLERDLASYRSPTSTKLPEGSLADSVMPSCHPDFPGPNKNAEQVMLTEITMLPGLPRITACPQIQAISITRWPDLCKVQSFEWSCCSFTLKASWGSSGFLDDTLVILQYIAHPIPEMPLGVPGGAGEGCLEHPD